MQTQISVYASPSVIRATALEVARARALAPRPSAPAHVRRWTGRAALTIPLPSLAALRIGGAGSSRN